MNPDSRLQGHVITLAQLVQRGAFNGPRGDDDLKSQLIRIYRAGSTTDVLADLAKQHGLGAPLVGLTDEERAALPPLDPDATNDPAEWVLMSGAPIVPRTPPGEVSEGAPPPDDIDSLPDASPRSAPAALVLAPPDCPLKRRHGPMARKREICPKCGAAPRAKGADTK